MNTLEELRNRIDQLDKELLQVLKNRFDVVEKIGQLKKEKGIPAFDEMRWNEVSKSRKALARSLHIPEHIIEEVFNIIHKYAIEVENKTKR